MTEPFQVWPRAPSFDRGPQQVEIRVERLAEGATGQIIAFTHDPDEMSWVARDFASLLKGSLQVFKKNAVEAAGVMVGPATASSRVAVGAACDGLACGARRPIEDARSQPDQQSSAKVRKKRIRHLRASYAPHV